jgi:two-component system response regulator MtrA
MKVLLVDDEPELLDITAFALRREGLNVIAASSGIEALERWEADKPDVVVLDVRLPDTTGFELCRRIREASETPVILLSALHDDDHIVQGFRIGADDFVTKPFSARVLAARIRAIWKRRTGARPRQTPEELRVGDLVLELEAHCVRRGSVWTQVTPLEFRILYLLATNAGRVVPAGRLLDYAWGYSGGDLALLKTHISHLRSKLGLPRSGPGAIRALPGVGYRLGVDAEAGAQRGGGKVPFQPRLPGHGQI